MIPTKIDTQELDAFLRVLLRVKDNGGRLDDGDIWFDPEAPPGCRDRTEILQSHKETLIRLRKSLEKCLHAEEKALTSNPSPSRVDVNSLPFEILTRIFLFSVQHDPPRYIANDHAKSLSHVSHGFRAIALETPALWNLVAGSRPLKETAAYLERSKSTPLTVVSDRQSQFVLSDFIEAVLPHAHRWGELYIYIRMENFDDVQFIVDLCDDELYLPMLTTLHNELYARRYDFNEWQLIFPCDWIMPRLRSYTAFNIIPDLSRSYIFDTTHCALHWGNRAGDHDGNSVEMANLLRSLKAMPKLQKLSLQFRHVVLGVDFSELSVVVLPLVENFTLALEGGETVEEIMNVLSRNLKLPNVVELSLQLRMESCLTNELP